MRRTMLGNLCSILMSYGGTAKIYEFRQFSRKHTIPLCQFLYHIRIISITINTLNRERQAVHFWAAFFIGGI